MHDLKQAAVWLARSAQHKNTTMFLRVLVIALAAVATAQDPCDCHPSGCPATPPPGCTLSCSDQAVVLCCACIQFSDGATRSRPCVCIHSITPRLSSISLSLFFLQRVCPLRSRIQHFSVVACSTESTILTWCFLCELTMHVRARSYTCAACRIWNLAAVYLIASPIMLTSAMCGCG